MINVVLGFLALICLAVFLSVRLGRDHKSIVGKAEDAKEPVVDTKLVSTNALLAGPVSVDSGDAVVSSDSLEQWRAYQAGKIPFKQLSEDNQARVNRSKYLQWEQEDKARRERIQAMDISMGINADVRGRETKLRKLAEKLYNGMGQVEVTALLGNPVKLLSSTNYSPSQRMRAGNHVMVFSPHPSGRTSYSMGDSFQYLEIWLDTNNTLAGYCWKSPGS